MTKYISTQFESDVRDELSFYMKNHYELEDLQEGLGMGTWLEFVKKTEGLEGDILELGIYRGGTTIMTVHFLKKLNSKRRVYACDAFMGLPYEDKYSIWENAKGMYSETSEKIVKEKFEKFGVSDTITIVKGLFEDTLYQKLSDKKFSLVLVDCDLYDATKLSMEFIFPRMVKGGIIMFDDYDRVNKQEATCGETTAVDEFCSTHNLKVEEFPEPHLRL